MDQQGINCKECGKPTHRFISPSKPDAGEDYCHHCHKSYPHDEKLAASR